MTRQEAEHRFVIGQFDQLGEPLGQQRLLPVVDLDQEVSVRAVLCRPAGGVPR
jgi:hypothetical protein